MKLNDACLHDAFPTPFTDEVLDNVGGYEVYSFTDGLSGTIIFKLTRKITIRPHLKQNGDPTSIQ